MFAKCAGCHRPGEAAPFSLLAYDDVRRRASQIGEVTQKRLMPPWLPSEQQLKFVGSRRLSDRELQLIEQWVAASAPEGAKSDLLSTPDFPGGWQAGPPDLVLESPPYDLAPDGRDQFRNFVVPLALDAPAWVETIELRPDNPRVTHHARLGVDSSYESIRRDGEDGQPGYAGMAWGQDPEGHLVAWAPGIVARRGTPGIAWRLHPKTCLVLHTHLQPSGKPEVVRFRIGIHFAKEAPSQRPVMMRIGSRDIDIPAGAARYVANDQYELPADVDASMIFPHAHSLCIAMQVDAVLPDGSGKTLIRIDRFDENWHDVYHYLEPVRLPRGTRLVSSFTYDNSSDNPRNRHRPPRRVVYGSNAEDEMADVYLQVLPVQPDQRARLLEDYTRHEWESQIVGFGRTMEGYPLDPWSREGMAACLVALGRAGEAVGVLEKRLAMEPAGIHPVVSLGMARFANGEFALAEERHRQALAMDPEYPLAWLGLGKALGAQKQNQAAEEAFRRAWELAPGLTEAGLNLAERLVQRGEWNEAASVCSAAMATSPEVPGSYLKLAEISAKQRRFDESLRYLKMAERFAPYNHPPKVLLSVFVFQNGDREHARSLLQEVHAEMPDHPVPSLFLGQMARRENRADEAREYLAASAAAALPGNWPESHKKRFLVLLHSERFQLAQQLEDLDLARDALAQWRQCDPQNIQVQKMYDQLQAGEGPP